MTVYPKRFKNVDYSNPIKLRVIFEENTRNLIVVNNEDHRIIKGMCGIEIINKVDNKMILKVETDIFGFGHGVTEESNSEV